MPLRLRTLAALALLAPATLVAPAAAQQGEPPPALVPPGEAPTPYPRLHGEQAQAVLTAMYEYMLAVYQRDGAAATQRVTRASRDYYARMRDLALTAPEAQVRAASLMDRLSILMLRHRVPAGELRALQGDAVFAYTVDHAWVGASATSSPPERFDADVFGEGDRALIRMEGMNAHFLREDGMWRLNLLPVLEAASAGFAPAPDSGMTEDELVLMVVEMSSGGRRVSPRIWQPVQ